MMGIGEPLDNYNNVIKFLKLVGHEKGLNIGYRHISLSTCGIVPKIEALAKENFPITLSISLHASDDETRNAIMPVNRKYPLDTLLTACKDYFDSTSRRISFEYTLLYGQNDRMEDAARLAALLRKYFPGKTPVHINLIRLNPVKERSFETPDDSRAYAFCAELERLGMNATLRRRLGKDIDAACGQLRRKRETT
jgi:23S rRNA (adenine2503-C2)-methyltransferase